MKDQLKIRPRPNLRLRRPRCRRLFFKSHRQHASAGRVARSVSMPGLATAATSAEVSVTTFGQAMAVRQQQLAAWEGRRRPQRHCMTPYRASPQDSLPFLAAGLTQYLLTGRSVQEVMDAVVEAVRPIDGTQDAEAARAAICDALSELLTRFPEADLLNLDPQQRAFAIERYTALDVFRRFDLDVGQIIRDKAPTATMALSHLKQARDYVRETVAASFRRLQDAGRPITTGRVSQVVRDALHETFQVFEGYAE